MARLLARDNPRRPSGRGAAGVGAAAARGAAHAGTTTSRPWSDRDLIGSHGSRRSPLDLPQAWMRLRFLEPEV